MTRAGALELLHELTTRNFAFAAFNVSNLETTQAVLSAADQRRAPVFVQLSPGAIAYAGYRTLTRLVFDLSEQVPVPVVIHLDHCRDPDVVLRAIDDGFGSVMFDGSRLDFAENTRITASIVARAREAGVAVEAELGIVGGIEDTTPKQARESMTSPDDARQFVEATGVDLLAPALGNVHRMPLDAVEVDLDRLREIADSCGRPVALHGGSGVAREQIRPAIAAGVGKVNISSNVSRALAAGIRSTWAVRPEEHDLRRYLGAGRDEVEHLVGEYLDLTNSSGRYGPAGLGRVRDTPPEFAEPE